MLNKQLVKEHIGDGNIKKAIEIMLPYYKDVLGQSATLSRVTKDHDAGTMYDDDFNIAVARVTKALLSYLEKDPDQYNSDLVRASPVQSNDGGHEPFKGPVPEFKPLKSQLTIFLNWFIKFVLDAREDQTNEMLNQLTNLNAWFAAFPEFVKFRLAFQAIQIQLEAGVMTPKEAYKAMQEQFETLTEIEKDFAFRVGLEPLYDKAISPAGKAEDIVRFLDAWKKKYPNESFVKSECKTTKALLENATIAEVGIVRAKAHLKSLTIMF